MRKLYFTAIAAIMLASCGYDGRFRYKCQDPANWNAEECKPPICNVDGTCTKDLLGFDPNGERVKVEE
jgi:hypothetical protein